MQRIEVSYTDTHKQSTTLGLQTLFEALDNEIFGPETLTEEIIYTLGTSTGIAMAKSVMLSYDPLSALKMESDMFDMYVLCLENCSELFQEIKPFILASGRITESLLNRIAEDKDNLEFFIDILLQEFGIVIEEQTMKLLVA